MFLIRSFRNTVRGSSRNSGTDLISDMNRIIPDRNINNDRPFHRIGILDFDELVARSIEIFIDQGVLDVTREQIPGLVRQVMETTGGNSEDSFAARMLLYSIVTASVEPLRYINQEVVYLPWYSDVEPVDEKCAICWGETGCDSKCQQCVNHFHKECVEPNLSSKERCPMCRHEIIEEN